VFAWIDAEKAEFPITTLCQVLQVSSSGFYASRGKLILPPWVKPGMDVKGKGKVVVAFKEPGPWIAIERPRRQSTRLSSSSRISSFPV
jgi:hypothetical protein